MKGRKNLLSCIILAILLAVVLFPILWMILIAFTPRQYLFESIIPPRFTSRHFIAVLTDTKALLAYRNSWIISGGVVFLTLILGIPAGYAFSRYKFSKLKTYLILFLLITQMLPITLLATAYFRIVPSFGLYNSLFALILVDGTLTLPFAVLLLRSTFDTVPKELEEVAMIDGCSKVEAFIRITLPLATAGIFAAAFFSFLTAWIEFLYGLTLTSNTAARPMTVEIANRLGHYVIHWGELMAMAFALSVPVLLVFLPFQNILLKGFTGGALKG